MRRRLRRGLHAGSTPGEPAAAQMDIRVRSPWESRDAAGACGEFEHLTSSIRGDRVVRAIRSVAPCKLAGGRLEFRILGPLEVIGPDGPAVVRGTKRRGLLAYLLVHAGEGVSLDRLVADLYDERGSAGADVEATRLDALRLQALQQRIAARLDLGHDAETIPELERLAGEHPLDEHFWAQLMVAYYRAGRQADALRAYQRARSLLAEELGVEPAAELQDLERRILDHDPELMLARPGPASTDACFPEGVVTFLLTDIEGSTPLWDHDPEAMSSAIARHEELVTHTVRSHRGWIVN